MICGDWFFSTTVVPCPLDYHHRVNVNDGARSEFVILHFFCFATFDMCLEPHVKVETCSDSQVCIIHLCPGLNSHLIKQQLASGSDIPRLSFFTLPSQFQSVTSPYCALLDRNIRKKNNPQMKDEIWGNISWKVRRCKKMQKLHLNFKPHSM